MRTQSWLDDLNEMDSWIKIVYVFLVSDERNCPKTGPRLCENEIKT